MLIDGFYHPLFHNTARMWAMNINKYSCLLILESHTRARCRSFIMYYVAKISQKTDCLSLLYYVLRSQNKPED